MLKGRHSKSGPRQNIVYGTLLLCRFDLI